MTRKEAAELLAQLAVAFPKTEVKPDTAKLYLDCLQQCSHVGMSRAVAQAITESKGFPPIAVLMEHYAVAKEQQRREAEQERTKLERLAEDNMVRPALQDIPEALEYLAKLRGVDEELHLERVQDGKCDDCPQVGARFKFAKLALCSKHVASRLRVKAQMEAA